MWGSPRLLGARSINMDVFHWTWRAWVLSDDHWNQGLGRQHWSTQTLWLVVTYIYPAPPAVYWTVQNLSSPGWESDISIHNATGHKPEPLHEARDEATSQYELCRPCAPQNLHDPYISWTANQRNVYIKCHKGAELAVGYPIGILGTGKKALTKARLP